MSDQLRSRVAISSEPEHHLLEGRRKFMIVCGDHHLPVSQLGTCLALPPSKNDVGKQGGMFKGELLYCSFRLTTLNGLDNFEQMAALGLDNFRTELQVGTLSSSRMLAKSCWTTEKMSPVGSVSQSKSAESSKWGDGSSVLGRSQRLEAAAEAWGCSD